MKFLIKILLFVFLPVSLNAQVNPLFIEPTKKQADSLELALKQTTNDTIRMESLRELALYYLDFNSDSSYYFIEKELPIVERLKLKLWEADALDLYGITLNNLGKYIEALKALNRSLEIAEDKESEIGIWRIGKFSSINDPFIARQNMLATIYTDLGGLYSATGNFDKVAIYARKSTITAIPVNNFTVLSLAYRGLAAVNWKNGNTDSALIYFNQSQVYSDKSGYKKYKGSTLTAIGKIYLQKKNFVTANKYFLAMILNDSLNNADKVKQFQNIGFDQQLKLDELEKEKIKTQSEIRTYAMLAGIGVFMLIAFLLYMNNRNRRKANSLLQKQKEELQSTLSELKATQSQLIQSEKMASLGELTAGIAHEIQNPLNFVNNFSEVNRELIEELKEEAKSGHNNEVIAIADDISANEEKIIHHGKRADAIVKGMLQHSRSSTGVKEPTDINALADEYLRLSYHGLRAKDKSFNAIMNTDFDTNVGKINIIPQDVGRVLLNLYNNAFYAVSEKKKQQPIGYEPTISVTTKKINNTVELTVKDNGNGIPQKVIDKIFQPFFTTKPTGVGTGLGLSLSYDIVKAHGGEIKVNTIEGEFTEFVIHLAILL